MDRAAFHVSAVYSMLYLTKTQLSLCYSAVSCVHYHGFVPKYEGSYCGSDPGAAAGGGRKDGCPTGGAGTGGCHLPWR